MNNRWQFGSTTQEMYMENVAMRWGVPGITNRLPRNGCDQRSGRLSEEAISRTLQEIEEIAQIWEIKEIFLVLTRWGILSCVKTIG